MDTIPTGVYPTKRLRKVLGRAGLDRALRDGSAKRTRRGWIQVGVPPSDIVAAIMRGGVMTCLSALARHQVWTPATPDLHVRGSDWAVRNRRGPFCRCYGRPYPEYEAVDDVATALAHTVHCLDDEGLLVVIDSVVHLGLMSFDEVEYLFRDAPERVQRVLARVDGRAESGPETMVRARLLAENVKLDIQVTVVGVGRVDILVGRWLIIEIGGWEFHGDRPHFNSDRTRMVNAQIRGYTYLPFSAEQVIFDEKGTHEAIMTAIRHGAHLRPSQLV